MIHLIKVINDPSLFCYVEQVLTNKGTEKEQLVIEDLR